MNSAAADPGERLTELLHAWTGGDSKAREELFSLVYADLLSRAEGQLRRERPGHTMRPSDIVNEAYLKLAELNRVEWKNRSQFFGIAATVMRRILVDHSRERASFKRGGDWRRTLVTLDQQAAGESEFDMLDLNEALSALGEHDRRKEQLVELRYFGGFSLEEAATALDVSLTTAKRDWNFARAWLYDRLREE